MRGPAFATITTTMTADWVTASRQAGEARWGAYDLRSGKNNPDYPAGHPPIRCGEIWAPQINATTAPKARNGPNGMPILRARPP